MTLIFIQDSPPVKNWRADMFTAARNKDTAELATLIPWCQNHAGVEFEEHLTRTLHDPTVFLTIAPHVAWNDSVVLRIARELRSNHTDHPQLVEWVNSTLMTRTAPELQPWQLHWAGLSEQWNQIEPFLQQGCPADMLFLCVIGSGNKDLLDMMTPYARSTLCDPVHVLALAYEFAHHTDDTSWIAPLVDQYTIDELSDHISASGQDLTAFGSYVVQHHLKELPEGSSFKAKRL